MSIIPESTIAGLGPIAGRTSQYSFNLINFDWVNWQTYDWENWVALDSILQVVIGFLNLRGVWRPTTDYIAGESVIDPNNAANLYLCLINHTSGTDFAADVAAMKWELRTDVEANVTSVFGRIGDIVAAAGDYTADQITFDPTGHGPLVGTDVDAVLLELLALIDVNADAITAETVARIADVDAEEAARIAAVSAEQAARIAADDAEEAARIAGDDAVQANLDAHTALTNNPHNTNHAALVINTAGAVDLNTLIGGADGTIAEYRLTAAPSLNGYDGAAAGDFVTFYRTDANNGRQFAQNFDPAVGQARVYVRDIVAGVWSAWAEISGGGGLFKGENGTVGNPVTGAGDIFRVNEQELNTSTTIGATENASCAGPLTIASGVTLTVASGGNLSIV